MKLTARSIMWFFKWISPIARGPEMDLIAGVSAVRIYGVCAFLDGGWLSSLKSKVSEKLYQWGANTEHYRAVVGRLLHQNIGLGIENARLKHGNDVLMTSLVELRMDGAVHFEAKYRRRPDVWRS